MKPVFKPWRVWIAGIALGIATIASSASPTQPTQPTPPAQPTMTIPDELPVDPPDDEEPGGVYPRDCFETPVIDRDCQRVDR